MTIRFTNTPSSKEKSRSSKKRCQVPKLCYHAKRKLPQALSAASSLSLHHQSGGNSRLSCQVQASMHKEDGEFSSPEIFGVFLAGRKVLPPNFTRYFTSEISNFKSNFKKKLHNPQLQAWQPQKLKAIALSRLQPRLALANGWPSKASFLLRNPGRGGRSFNRARVARNWCCSSFV